LASDLRDRTSTITTFEHRQPPPALGETGQPSPASRRLDPSIERSKRPGSFLRILFSRRSFALLQHISRAVEPPIPIEDHGGPPHQISSHQISAAEAALLTLADPSLGSRISLIGPHTLELLCALVRRGSTNVLATRLRDRPQAGTADVAIIPDVMSSDCLGRAIAHARRVLAPLGTIAIHLLTDPADALSQQAGQLLLLHGFSAIRVVDFCGETLMRGELPLYGRLGCA